ncbi:pyrroline-5-carboxylate reductase dimerization domain-containing protein [Ditylenchus destructor]|nr:pyrroline-5-carboxylate reductase dimerization domain-containing protein [Ditylenchus destructor]
MAAKFHEIYDKCFGAGNPRKLRVLGGGKMAAAMVDGFVKSGCFEKENVSICTKSQATADSWTKKGYSAHTSNDFYSNTDAEGIILIGVKPQSLTSFADEFVTRWSIVETKCVIVSILAGASLSQLRNQLKSSRVIRLMPNVGCRVGQGTLLVCSDLPDTNTVDMVTELGSSVGYCRTVDEKSFDAASAIAGCGPAFIYMVIEAIADGGVYSGLNRELAVKLAAEMVKGSAALLSQENAHPGQLKDSVCSPAGTTIAGVRKLEQAGVRSAFMEAIHASTLRASELSQIAEGKK